MNKVKKSLIISLLLICGCTQPIALINDSVINDSVINDSMPYRLIPNDTIINDSYNPQVESEVNLSGINLFFSASFNSQDHYSAAADVSWETSAKGVFRYLPESGYASVVKSYTSASYSKSSCYAFTINGRLFVARDWGSDWTSDDTSWTLEEYDPYTSEVLSTTQFEAGSFAVINDKVYVRTPIIKNFYGQVTGGGDLYVQTLGDSSSQARIVFEDFSGGLWGVGDYLIASWYDLETETLTLSNIDLSSGALTTLYTIPTTDSPYNDLFPGHNAMYHLIQDDDLFYINRYPVEGEAQTILEVELIGEEQGVYVGEDDGLVAILTIDGSYNIISLVTYDLSSGVISEVPLESFSSSISYTRVGVPFLILD